MRAAGAAPFGTRFEHHAITPGLSEVVSDIVLPEMDGPSAVSKLQKLHPEIQVLFVSGFAEVPIAQQLIAEGAPLLQKPVSRIDLMRKIDEMLHSRVSHC